MSEHQRQTAFLRHCLRHDDSAEHEALDKKITKLQREDRCVRQAVWLMAVLTALAVACLGYAAVLVANFQTLRIVQVISALGLASLISLVFFVGLRITYRLKLDRRREEYRQFVSKIMKSRPGPPGITPVQDSRVDDGNRGSVKPAGTVNGSPAKTGTR